MRHPAHIEEESLNAIFVAGSEGDVSVYIYWSIITY
jgi:hypothetical protein